MGEDRLDLRDALAAHAPVVAATLEPAPADAAAFAGRRVVAFAGIGLPGKFKATLEGLGAKIALWRSFPDHHIFSVDELRRLQAQAAQKQAPLVTTEKDLVRIVIKQSYLSLEKRCVNKSISFLKLVILCCLTTVIMKLTTWFKNNSWAVKIQRVIALFAILTIVA